MKKFITLSTTFIFVLILTSFNFAQEMKPPTLPKIPTKVPAVNDKKEAATTGVDGQKYDVPIIAKENLKEGKIKT